MHSTFFSLVTISFLLIFIFISLNFQIITASLTRQRQRTVQNVNKTLHSSNKSTTARPIIQGKKKNLINLASKKLPPKEPPKKQIKKTKIKGPIGTHSNIKTQVYNYQSSRTKNHDRQSLNQKIFEKLCSPTVMTDKSSILNQFIKDKKEKRFSILRNHKDQPLVTDKDLNEFSTLITAFKSCFHFTSSNSKSSLIFSWLIDQFFDESIMDFITNSIINTKNKNSNVYNELQESIRHISENLRDERIPSSAINVFLSKTGRDKKKTIQSLLSVNASRGR